MRGSKLVCAVMAGGIVVGACSPSAEPSSVPPHPGTPPPAWEAGEPGSDMAPNPAADRVFPQQVRASQERVIALARVAEDKGMAQLRPVAQQLRAQAEKHLRAVSSAAEAAPEDAQVEKTEGLPSDAQIAQLAELNGQEFRKAWLAEMRNLQDYTLQLANNQTDLGQHGQDRRWFALAERMSTATQESLARLNSLR